MLLPPEVARSCQSTSLSALALPPTPTSVELTATGPPPPMISHSLYALPMAAIGMINFLFEVYLLKFATDVLLLAPAVMGTIFSISRIWDAVSDPLCGYLSDATRNSFGRRRSWMLGSALPLWCAFVACFSPPQLADAAGLSLWMLPSVLAYYTSRTAFEVPHLAFGTELTQDASYHERSSLYAWRQAFANLGSLLGVGALFVLMAREPTGPSAVRQAAFWISDDI